MTLDIQTYKDVFSCFPSYRNGLQVGDVILQQHLMNLFGLMPDIAQQVLVTMENEGYLVKDDGTPKTKLGSIQNGWHLTEEGYQLYRRLNG